MNKEGKVNLELLKKLRKDNNLSQEEVSLKLGYKTKLGYHYIETGRCNLKAEQMLILSELYNVPIGYFFKSDITNMEMAE